MGTSITLFTRNIQKYKIKLIDISKLTFDCISLETNYDYLLTNIEFRLISFYFCSLICCKFVTDI